MVDHLIDAPPGVALRPATPTDRDFLVALFRTTREDELSITGWDEAAKAAFVELQFAAQDQSYRLAYPAGRFDVVERDGRRIGRLSTVRLADEIRIVDIVLLPDERGAGIGTALIDAVLAEAGSLGLAVRLHVEPWNPARRLYERLGFVGVEQRGFHELMERPAAGQLKTAS